MGIRKYKNDKEKREAYRKRARKNYYANKEAYAERSRKWREKNKERHSEYCRKYYHKHKHMLYERHGRLRKTKGKARDSLKRVEARLEYIQMEIIRYRDSLVSCHYNERHRISQKITKLNVEWASLMEKKAMLEEILSFDRGRKRGRPRADE